MTLQGSPATHPASDKPIPIQRRLFTLNEAAAVLGVSQRSLYRMVAKGTIASLKVGHHRYFTHGALRDFLAEAWLNEETRPYVEELLAKPAGTATPEAER